MASKDHNKIDRPAQSPAVLLARNRSARAHPPNIGSLGHLRHGFQGSSWPYNATILVRTAEMSSSKDEGVEKQGNRVQTEW
jgi:hypothetical protein